MTSLIIGIVLIVGGVAFAAAPFFRRRGESAIPDATGISGIAGAAGAAGAADTAGAGADSVAARRVARAPSATSPSLIPDDAIAMARDELELDLAMGKLSPDDYRVLRARLDKPAAAVPAPRAGASGAESAVAMPDAAPRGEDGGRGGSSNETLHSATAPLSHDARVTGAVEAEADRLVRAMRATIVSCPDCGPRPEPAAPFCSRCGRALGGCPSCGHSITQTGARYCDRCGTPLAR